MPLAARKPQNDRQLGVPTRIQFSLWYGARCRSPATLVIESTEVRWNEHARFWRPYDLLGEERQANRDVRLREIERNAGLGKLVVDSDGCGRSGAGEPVY